jgi:hypothetical protein
VIADTIAKDQGETKSILTEEYSNIYGIFGESLVPLVTSRFNTEES